MICGKMKESPGDQGSGQGIDKGRVHEAVRGVLFFWPGIWEQDEVRIYGLGGYKIGDGIVGIQSKQSNICQVGATDFTTCFADTFQHSVDSKVVRGGIS